MGTNPMSNHTRMLRFKSCSAQRSLFTATLCALLAVPAAAMKSREITSGDCFTCGKRTPLKGSLIVRGPTTPLDAIGLGAHLQLVCSAKCLHYKGKIPLTPCPADKAFGFGSRLLNLLDDGVPESFPALPPAETDPAPSNPAVELEKLWLLKCATCHKAFHERSEARHVL